MLKVKLIAVGKIKEKYLCEACGEYVKRLKGYCKLEICEIPEVSLSREPSPTETQKVLSREGESILKAIKGSDYVIAMCIEGKQLSSEELAQRFSDISLSGKSTVSIVIGSSFGLCGAVKERADMKLSMSKMTFPHMLARVMVLEQTYRAFSILGNSKYHK